MADRILFNDTRKLVHTLAPDTTLTLEVGAWTCGCRMFEDPTQIAKQGHAMTAAFCAEGKPRGDPGFLSKERFIEHKQADGRAAAHRRSILWYKLDTLTTRGKGSFVEAPAFDSAQGRAMLAVHGVPFVSAPVVRQFLVPAPIAGFGAIARTNTTTLYDGGCVVVTTGDILARCVWDHEFRKLVKYIVDLAKTEGTQKALVQRLADLYHQRTP